MSEPARIIEFPAHRSRGVAVLLTKRELAARWNVSPRWIEERQRHDGLPVQKDARSRLVRYDLNEDRGVARGETVVIEPSTKCEQPPAHLLSAAAALERILSNRHPERQWIVSVREDGDERHGPRDEPGANRVFPSVESGEPAEYRPSSREIAPPAPGGRPRRESNAGPDDPEEGTP